MHPGIRIVDPRPFERVMVFIDGGYLRAQCRKYHGSELMNFNKIRKSIISTFNNMEGNTFQANLIRIYYYDAIVDKNHPDFNEQKSYFLILEAPPNSITVKLGECVQSSKDGLRQKGVDVLMAIDSLTKAYQNQYDVAFFILGDRDFIPLINAIKDTGKKTICCTSLENPVTELLSCFDGIITLGKEAFDDWVIK